MMTTKPNVYPLQPHVPSTVIEIKGKEIVVPTIKLSLDAYRDTHHIMEEAGPEEVGWLGTVEKLDDRSFLIDKVFLFRQTVSTGHCEFDSSDLGKFCHELLKKDRANKAVVNSLKFWGHLHPGHMTSPSQQDDKQMEVFSNNAYFIRGIFTRNRACVFTYYDYVNEVTITDCPWELHVPDDDRRAEIAAEIAEKVTKVSGRKALYGGE